MESAVLRLSPSSAVDFKNCAQLFKFRFVDRLPEHVSPAAARGSLVHATLEQLFSEAAPDRTQARATELLTNLWNEVRTSPEFATGSEGDEGTWLDEARRHLGNYFKLEDPRTVTASRLEWWVEFELPDVHLRGVIDRVEENPDGSWVLTDYKTGRLPGESRELAAFFGLRFYALVCWRAFGVIPKEIRLVYLADPSVLSLHPHEQMLTAFQKQMEALGKAIQRAHGSGDWRPRPSPFCMACSFQDRCPAWAHSTEEVDR